MSHLFIDVQDHSRLIEPLIAVNRETHEKAVKGCQVPCKVYFKNKKGDGRTFHGKVNFSAHLFIHPKYKPENAYLGFMSEEEINPAKKELPPPPENQNPLYVAPEPDEVF